MCILPDTQEQFPDYPELLKMSISLGRQLQEPLQEFVALASSQDDEILSLRLHPLQGELPSDRLKLFLEEELVTRVNDFGVDVHYLQEHPHAVGLLQYACGLGPRKATAILKVCGGCGILGVWLVGVACENYYFVVM